MRRLAVPGKAGDWQRAFSLAVYGGLAAGVIGARLAYAAQFHPIYVQTPRLLLSLQPGTLAEVPGLIVGVGVALILLHRVQMPTSTILDNAALVSVSVLIVLALGQFATGDRYGVPTDLPWGVELWQVRRHPVQFYEAISLAVILAVLWRMMPTALPGEIFWYGVLYVGVTELLLEAFRGTSNTAVAGIRVSQVVSLAAVLLALYIIAFYAGQRQRDLSQTKL